MTMAPLLGQLRDSARAEAEAREAHARADAAARLDEATRRFERRHAEALAERAAWWAREREQQLDAARVGATRDVLAAAERVVNRVLRQAVQRFATEASSPAATRWLHGALVEAVTYLPAGPVTVRSDPGLAIPSSVDGRALTHEHDAAASGVVLLSTDGRVRVDATLDRFLVAERPRISQAILQRLTRSPE